MTDAHYKDSLEAAKTEMEALLAEEQEIQARISTIQTRLTALRKIALSLGELLGEEWEQQTVGITDAIRKVMRRAKSPEGSFIYIHPTTIRTRLQNDGFPLGDYKNPMAVIHTTMKRLEDQGEVEGAEGRNGRTIYKWTGSETEITDEDIPF
jgi:hypothetical protein